MNENVIIALISALLGGGLAQIFNYFLVSKKQNSNDYSAVLKLWKEDNERLRKIETDLRNEVENLRDVVADLSNKIVLLESAHLSFPFPMWLKGLDGKMLVVNDAYDKVFLEPRGLDSVDYIGFDDDKIWGEELAKTMNKMDLAARTSGKDHVRFVMGIHGVDYLVIKYVRRLDSVAIGVGGIAVKLGDYDDVK